MQELLSSDFVKLSLPLLAAVLAWIANERSKRAQEQYSRKEQNYKELLSNLHGFYIATQDTKTKQAFLDQLNQCWLYCPDEVIERAYAFLDTVKMGANATDSTKELACGEFIVAVRNDILSRRVVNKTRLQGKDFRHFRAT